MKTAKLDINRASRRDFEKLPLIGPKRAARIVAFRERNGWFGSIDDLDRVPGIGNAIIRRLRGFLTV